MIILKEVSEYDIELQAILELAVVDLQNKFNGNESLIKLSGTAFEREVCNVLNEVSTGSDFHNKFEQSSPHFFPDLFVKFLNNNWFGIEVKTSQNDWKCFGNSIFESVKVPNLEDRIYVFFGKFSSSSKSLECKWARYDECVDNINITHSPRYQINMAVKEDPALSVFHKMNITYLKFRSIETSTRMDYVRKLKRQGVGENIALWWLPDSDTPSKEDEEKLLIKSFSLLSVTEKSEIRNHAMILFPIIFSKADKVKYNAVLIWLASQYGVVTGNIRDHFSAGGQFKITFQGTSFKLPHICKHIFDGKDSIKSIISKTERDELAVKWDLDFDATPMDFESRIKIWIDLVIFNLTEQKLPENFPLRKWLDNLFR